jgi:hypothetical protein
MKALKLVAEPKTNITELNNRVETNEYNQISEPELIKLFPLPRYFQIHFQYAHENINELKAEVATLKYTVQEMNTKIDFLLQLLTKTSC